MHRLAGMLRWGMIGCLLGAFVAPGPISAAASVGQTRQRYIIRTNGGAAYTQWHAQIVQSGGSFIIDRPDLNLMAVSLPGTALAQLQTGSSQAALAPDRIEDLADGGDQARPGRMERQSVSISGVGAAGSPGQPAGPSSVTPDPVFGLSGLLWNYGRINAPATWQKPVGLGAAYVLVGVIDTGLDYTHIELTNKVVGQVDFTATDDPNLCVTQFSDPTDAQLAIAFGAPSADLDFNGHGTLVGGLIAAKLNLTGTNGLAPAVGLVSLKVAQNCGVAYDADILRAILYAADNGLDVATLTFSHYLDRSDPAQDTLYQAYADVAAYALAHGTAIVAGAGDEHARIGASGQVIGHGTLSNAPGGVDDYGLWQVPGGLPGVVDVSATSNVVNAPAATCPGDSLAAIGHEWCKPTSDLHQPFGVGRHNQLAAYSNYGPRIDLAAPGGARKFNLPAIDRGGAEGWPWTGITSVEGGTSVADGYNAWEDFTITSNYATVIPCFTFTASATLPANQCYAVQDGTSLAAAHVAAAMAEAASAVPSLWRHPTNLIAFIKAHTTPLSGNSTPPASASDKSNGDGVANPCPNGYCHLGGAAISSAEAYGAGLVDDYGPFWPKTFLPFLQR